MYGRDTSCLLIVALRYMWLPIVVMERGREGEREGGRERGRQREGGMEREGGKVGWRKGGRER